MVRFVCYLVFFNLLLRCSATLPSLPSINLVVNEDGDQSLQENYSDPIEFNESFQIKVENLIGNNILQNITCRGVDKGTIYVDAKLTKINTMHYTVTIREAQVTEESWKCIIANIQRKKLEVTLKIKLKKKGKEETSSKVSIRENQKVIILVNDVEIKTPLTAEFVYDGQYMYRKGELARITCVNPPGTFINLEFQNTSDHKSDTPVSLPYQDVLGQTLYIKLTEKQLFICNVKTKTRPYLKYTARLTLLMKPKSNKDERSFYVNGMILAPSVSQNINYRYEYYKEETLSIKGFLKNPNDKWYCEPNPDNIAQLNPFKTVKNHIDVNVVLPRNITTATVDCRAGSTPVILTLVQQYVKELDSNIPTISGLSSAQILLAYKPHPEKRFIKYTNHRIKNLNLTCISTFSGCKWLKDDKEVVVRKNDDYSNGTNHYTIEYTYEPLQNETSTVIKCKCKNTKYTEEYSTAVEIINDLNEPEDTGETEYTTGFDIGHTEGNAVMEVIPDGLPDEGGTNNNPESDPPISIEMMAGIIGGTIVIVILVIWIIVGIHKRKRRQEQAQQASDINYENLPEHNEGPMSVPAQWNHYSRSPQPEETYDYAVPYDKKKNIEDMYAKPQPKAVRQPMETLYAEVGHQGDPNYATVVPEAPKTEYANLSQQQMPLYSQIQPKKLQNNARSAPQVLPRLPANENYAQVLPKSIRRDGEAYQNVFENQRYANTQAKDDYAEPAYCEVNLKKTK